MLPLQTTHDLVHEIAVQQSKNSGIEQLPTEHQLREWLARDPRIQHYLRDPDALARMTPSDTRYPDYENVIRQIVGIAQARSRS
jgi:hypothetical protein